MEGLVLGEAVAGELRVGREGNRDKSLNEVEIESVFTPKKTGALHRPTSLKATHSNLAWSPKSLAKQALLGSLMTYLPGLSVYIKNNFLFLDTVFPPYLLQYLVSLTILIITDIRSVV